MTTTWEAHRFGRSIVRPHLSEAEAREWVRDLNEGKTQNLYAVREFNKAKQATAPNIAQRRAGIISLKA